MKQHLIAILTVGILVTLCLNGVFLAEPVVDTILSHYPGATRIEEENFDTSYLKHGWLARQAIYQSPDDLENVLLWYAAYLPQAEMHETATCVALRQSQTVFHILRAISVLLCRLAPGTRIVVNENIFVSR